MIEPRRIKWQGNRPMCGCVGVYCLGKKDPAELCMAHDNWHTPPCRDGRCPGPMDPGCCHDSGDGAHTIDEE